MDLQTGIAIVNGAQLPAGDAVICQDRQRLCCLVGREDDDHSDTAIERPHHFMIGNVAACLKPLKNSR